MMTTLTGKVGHDSCKVWKERFECCYYQQRRRGRLFGRRKIFLLVLAVTRRIIIMFVSFSALLLLDEEEEELSLFFPFRRRDGCGTKPMHGNVHLLIRCVATIDESMSHNSLPLN